MEIGNDNIYSLILLSNIFGGGASSIIFQKIREELGMCYSIYSYSSSMINTGIVSIYAGLNSKYLQGALEAIKEELNKFTVDRISNEKLIKAKEQLKGNYILGLESTSSRMFSNGRSAMFLNKINTPREVIKKIDDINKNKIEEVMRRTFNKGIMNSGIVGNNFDLVRKSINMNIINMDKI